MLAYPWGYAHVVNSPVAPSSNQTAWQIVVSPIWTRLSSLATQLNLPPAHLHELRCLALDDLDYRLPPWLGVEPMYGMARPEVLLRFHLLPVPDMPTRPSNWVNSVYLPMVLPTVLDVFEAGLGDTLGVFARLLHARAPIGSRGGPREER